MRFRLITGSAQFSSLNNRDNKDDHRHEYKSKFEDLIGKASTPLSKEEQDFIDRQVETKKAMDEEAQRKTEAQKQKSAEQNIQDFEKITKGEHIDNRNLQQLFTEFYSNLNEKRK